MESPIITGLQVKTRGKRIKDISGKRFGKLLVIGTAGRDESGTILWRIQCDCGRTLEYPKESIIGARSCGCARGSGPRYTAKRMGLVEYPDHFVSVYRLYMKGAFQRGYSFDLRPERFLDLIMSDCHYCGLPASQGNTKGTLRYNGVDRKDNTKGYTLENSVPCCGTCNIAKGTHQYDDFLAWVRRVATHQRLLESDTA